MAVAKTFTVTVATGNKYIVGGTGDVFYIDGSRNSPPEINWLRGATSRWDQSDSSNDNHPILFTNNLDNLEAGRITSGVTYYLDGVATFADWTNLATFNAATTRYIEFTPDQSLGLTQNAPYYYCYIHGIGMGGPIPLRNNVYGAGYFGYGNYNDQGNTQNTLSGYSLSSNLNSVTVYLSVGWGAQVWGNGEWGELDSPEVIPTGISLSANLGTPSITAEVNVGWSAKTWGYPEGGGWGNLFDVNQPLTGFNLTSTLGEETVIGEINAGWGRSTWGASGWSIAGTLQLSGIQMSANIGSVSIDNQINIGWGSDTWGYETWGASGLLVPLTGIELSSNIGSVSFDISGKAEPTGQELTTAVDDAEAFASFTEEVTGIPLIATLTFQEAVVNVTGIAMSMQEGDEVATPNTIATVSATSASTWNGNFAWGYGVWGNEPINTLAMSMQEGNVDPAPDVSLTGNAAAMFVGDETVTGDANTGTITSIKWGEETWGQSTWGNGTYLSGASYSQTATINLGTAVGDANTIASITGQLMIMQEGDEGTTANARVNVTGINLTFSVGTVYNLIWNEVNTGTTSIWTEVDTAA